MFPTAKQVKNKMSATDLDLSVGGARDEVLLGGVEGHAAYRRVVRLERVTQLSLTHVEDADVSPLPGADQHLVAGRVTDRRAAVSVALEAWEKDRR